MTTIYYPIFTMLGMKLLFFLHKHIYNFTQLFILYVIFIEELFSCNINNIQ